MFADKVQKEKNSPKVKSKLSSFYNSQRKTNDAVSVKDSQSQVNIYDKSGKFTNKLRLKVIQGLEPTDPNKSWQIFQEENSRYNMDIVNAGGFGYLLTELDHYKRYYVNENNDLIKFENKKFVFEDKETYDKDKKDEAKAGREIKNFSKLLSEAYNPIEEQLNTKVKNYTFDDTYSVEKVVDKFLNIDSKDYFMEKLSVYERAQLSRMLIFIDFGIRGIIKECKQDDQGVITPPAITHDNRIFFKYIADGTYKNIRETISTLIGAGEVVYGKGNEFSIPECSEKGEYDKFDGDLQRFYKLEELEINKEVSDTIKESYKLYDGQEREVFSGFNERNVKKYAKTIKKMLSKTFIPRYSVNKKDYELIYDKEFSEELRKEEGKIDTHINNPIFMNLLTPEERVKLIRTYQTILKNNKSSNNNKDKKYGTPISELVKNQQEDASNLPKAITFDPDYKKVPNVTYIKSGVIKNSQGNFTLHKIGKETKESDKPEDKPVFEAHSASNGTGAKSEITHCFIRFRATEYDPDERVSDQSPYKRKVYSLGFYPGFYDGNLNSNVKEPSLFRRLTNEVLGQPSVRGLIRDDSEHYSQIAITRKCDNKKISELDECIHNFADRERYNLALNNCTAFVSKISKGIGYRDISNMFRSFVLYSPNLAAGKLVHAMMSGKYKEGGDTSFKTEDFVHKFGVEEDVKKGVLNKHGNDFFSKRSSHGILYEMIHKVSVKGEEKEYTDLYTDIEKKEVSGLGRKAYNAFTATYNNYIEPFYKDNGTDWKNKEKFEFLKIWFRAEFNLKSLTLDKKNFEELPKQSKGELVKDRYQKYDNSLNNTLKVMKELRKISLKHKNIRAFLMANCFVDRIEQEQKKIEGTNKKPAVELKSKDNQNSTNNDW